MSRYDDAVNDLAHLNSREFGWFLSSVRNSVSITDPAERKKQQDALEQLTWGLAIVYMFAIFEDYFPLSEVRQKHKFIDEYLAYRHIRHSFAHKKPGERANNQRAEFESFYKSGG